MEGRILYDVYIDIEGPVIWQEVTGSKMESVNDIVEHYFNNHSSNDKSFQNKKSHKEGLDEVSETDDADDASDNLPF